MGHLIWAVELRAVHAFGIRLAGVIRGELMSSMERRLKLCWERGNRAADAGIVEFVAQRVSVGRATKVPTLYFFNTYCVLLKVHMFNVEAGLICAGQIHPNCMSMSMSFNMFGQVREDWNWSPQSPFGACFWPSQLRQYDRAGHLADAAGPTGGTFRVGPSKTAMRGLTF